MRSGVEMKWYDAIDRTANGKGTTREPARISSTTIAERVNAGTLAIVGLTYHLADGRVVLRDHLGDIGEV